MKYLPKLQPMRVFKKTEERFKFNETLPTYRIIELEPDYGDG
ncbi:hypothetical protein P4C99_20545 [Pontiellaceae bacterium B1224]|nr:hypothetical protein [Pontiellaceae bacterium B1224]